MIEIRNLSKTYPGNIHALNAIDLTVSGNMFGLLGANGAGKTTLLRIIAGLLRPTQGSISVFGHDITTSQGKRAAKALLGYLPQELGLYPTLSAREFLDYIAILKGITDKRLREHQIDQVLDLVRLGDVADRKLRTYSGGMKRRVGIAQALLGNPQLLMVDEPTSGLDPEERVHLRNLLSDMAKTCTVILSTHIVEDINQSCTDLVVLQRGRIIFRGSPGELIQTARGHVWFITTTGERPNDNLITVSTLQVQDGIQYRILGQPADHYHPIPAEPSLEDGYLWLMSQLRAVV